MTHLLYIVVGKTNTQLSLTQFPAFSANPLSLRADIRTKENEDHGENQFGATKLSKVQEARAFDVAVLSAGGGHGGRFVRRCEMHW